ncbi:hypothetical protein F5Y14DRAFT_417241 [Nemania sp. NC0429]|nr:hypothetical protein F5Y14DRAFT_417241 [Nemania sp. NC0429]
MNNEVPESWDDLPGDEGQEEVDTVATSRNKVDKRRIKQRERRQKWRRAKYSDVEVMDKPLDLSDTSPPSSPTTSNIPRRDAAVHVNGRRHRRSPLERSVAFFAQLFKHDTRPADWDLVCSEPGEYMEFPHRQLVLPLSRLSALVWETQYEMASIDIASLDSDALAGVIRYLERDLSFYDRHIANAGRITHEWDKISKTDVLPEKQVQLKFYRKYLKGAYFTAKGQRGCTDDEALAIIAHTSRTLAYGSRVLKRVMDLLQMQHSKLVGQLQAALTESVYEG